MIAKLIKISDLKAKAVGEVVEYLVNKPKSFVPSFFGKPATNLDWYKKSMHFYKLATKTNSAKKISYLMNALIDIYKCTELMKQSKFNDEKITAGQKKIERFYLNYVLNFIEESLQDIDKIKDYEIVENAIAILSETNSNIASKYKRHLTNHISGSDYHQRILELLRTPNANFTSEISVRINMAFNYNKKFYEKKKKNKNQLIKSITKKINDKYLYFNKKIDNELQKNNPSIYTILEYIKKFEEIANPINRILENSYKNKFLDMKEALENILTFMQNDYQYAKKSFKYLSLSHNRLDIKRILDSQKSLSNMNFDKIKKYEEISELSPSISVMKRKFDKSLNNYFKETFNKLFSEYDRIVTISQNDTKTKELQKLLDKIQLEIEEEKYGNFLEEKLSFISDTIEFQLKNILITNLINDASKTNTIDEIHKVFDSHFKKFLLLNNSKLLSYISKAKKEILVLCRKRFDNSKFEENIHKSFNPIQKKFKTKELLKPTKIDKKQMILIDNFSNQNYIIFFKPIISIGRNKKNDIILPEKWVSKQHCLIDLSQNQILDLGSTNGTFVNGKQIINVSIDEVYSVVISNIFYFDFRIFEDTFGLNFSHLKQKNDEIDHKLVEQLNETKFIFSENFQDIFINTKTGRVASKSEVDISNAIQISIAQQKYFFGEKSFNLHEGLNQLSDRFTLKI